MPLVAVCNAPVVELVFEPVPPVACVSAPVEPLLNVVVSSRTVPLPDVTADKPPVFVTAGAVYALYSNTSAAFVGVSAEL